MRLPALTPLLLLVTFGGCRPHSRLEETRALVRAEFERHPEAGLADLYSMLLHGALGPAHGVVDSAGATAWLMRELATLRAGGPEAIAETLRGDSLLVRVNLRPYLAAGGDPGGLAEAFVRTGREVPPDEARLEGHLDALVMMADAGELPWPVDSVRRFVERMDSTDHALLPHSPAYHAAYRPAYRILRRDLLRALLPDLADSALFALGGPPFVVGAFEDDYGGHHTVSAAEWQQGTKARYRIVGWHPTARYLIAQNDSANPTAPNGWTRIDWVTLEGMPPWEWAFCFSAYDAPSADSAEATRVARPETPRTGCNRFPYSRLKRVSR